MPLNLSLRRDCINAGVDRFNLPLGDKVAFQIFRGDVPRELWEEEKIAVAIILKEQRRKRQAKKENERLYSNFLKFNQGDKWEEACINLLVFIQCLAKEYCQKDLGEAVSDNLIDLAVEPCQGEVLSCLVDNLQERSLNFNQSPDFVCSDGQDGLYGLSDLMRIILNANFDDRHWEFVGFFSKRFLEGVEVSMKEACEKATTSFFKYFCEQHICTEGPNSARYNRFVDKMFDLGFSFDNIVGELKVHKIYFRRLENCFEYYSPERGMSRKLIQVYFGDDRFVAFEEIDGIPVYKKRRLPGDKPWDSREGLAESDYHYIKDKRGAFIKRYTYRFIRPDERMLLSRSISRSPDFVTYPMDKDRPLCEMEVEVGNKLLAPGDNLDPNRPPPEPLDEFCLSRFGTDRYRLIATGHAAHKYDVRGNDRAEFLRSALTFDKFPPSSRQLVQGGGLIKIDLLQVGSDHVRCLYHSASRVALDGVKGMLIGVKEGRNSRFAKDDPSLLERDPAEYLYEELCQSKVSSVRNRETHLSQLPMKAIVGWKPYPQFPFWLKRTQITSPIIRSEFTKKAMQKEMVSFFSYPEKNTPALNLANSKIYHEPPYNSEAYPFYRPDNYIFFSSRFACYLPHDSKNPYDVRKFFYVILWPLLMDGMSEECSFRLALAILSCFHAFILLLIECHDDIEVFLSGISGRIKESFLLGAEIRELNFDEKKGELTVALVNGDRKELDLADLISFEVIQSYQQKLSHPDYSLHRSMAFFMHPERTVPQDIDAQIDAAP